MFSSFKRVRNLRRYHTIISVLTRHGFGSVLHMLQADRYLPLPPRITRSEIPAVQHTPAVHLRLALEELGPTFVKLGQVLSTRPDLLPPKFIIELSRLQDRVPPVEWQQICTVMETEYGRDPADIFSSIDPTPLGSASLSQVHAATLKTGEEVVIKVLRPNIEAVIEADLEILNDIARLAQRTQVGRHYDIVGIVDHFSFTLRNELDYRREGLNAERFRMNFEDDPFLYIPKVYWDASTQRILVLERLSGIKFGSPEALVEAGVDLQELAYHTSRVIVKEIMEDGFFHADPHPGNFVVTPKSCLDEQDSEAESPEERPAEQVEFCLGVMDFGMVGFISRTDRMNLVQAAYLASRNDAAGLVEHMLRMGALPDRVDTRALEREIERIFNRYSGLPLKELEARQILDELLNLAFHYRISLPPDLWLLFKTITMMEGLARQFNPEFNMLQIFEPQIRRVFVQNRMPWEWGPAFLSDLESLAFTLKELPSIGEGLLRGIQQGEFPLTIRMAASKETMDRLDRVSTRFSLSIITAAFILGLAILLPLASGSTIATALVAIGFFAALMLGVWIVLSILRSGK